MKSREELIEAWLDTDERVASGQYPMEARVSRYSTPVLYGTGLRSQLNSCNVLVENRDCIEVAKDLSKLGKTCILNMASYKRPGGGVKKGSMAQEEELARRSNLLWGLPEDCYPLKKTDYIYTNKVTFFKDRNYQIIPEFNCDVVTIAAINLNGLEKPANYVELTRQKIEAMVLEPYFKGCDNLVLSAFGCGVFKNDPIFIANIFSDVLEIHKSLYKNITFAILDDGNSVGMNYQIFKSIIK